MDVARLNFSHGSPATRAAAAVAVRRSAAAAGQPVAILADLAGPKIRLGELSRGAVALAAGRPFRLSARGAGKPGGVDGATISYQRIAAQCSINGTIVKIFSVIIVRQVSGNYVGEFF